MKQNILITGASSGLGEALAYAAADAGYSLILTARSSAKLEAIKSDLGSRYPSLKVSVYPADLTDEQEWEQTLDSILEKERGVDAVINNAGIGYFRTFSETTAEQAGRMLTLNVQAVLQTVRKVLPVLRAQNSGHIINIASMAGKVATPKAAVYAASKHAVLGFTNSLRQELMGTGISVTAVNLGPVKTDFFKTADPSGNYERASSGYMLDSRLVASKIVKMLKKPKREFNMPWWMGAGSKLYLLAPSLAEKFLSRQLRKK